MTISQDWSPIAGPERSWRASAPAIADWSDLDPRPQLELEREGTLLRTNAAAERLIAEQTLRLVASRIRFFDAGSDLRFADALRAAAVRPRQAIVVATHDGRLRSAQLLAAPLASTLILVLGEAELRANGFAAVAEAFDLTPGETRVLQRLCDGASGRAIAQAMHISEHTVRSHLRALYAKLGVRRLANLIRLTVQLTT